MESQTWDLTELAVALQVSDWTTDFCDGTALCALVENLQKRPLKPSWNRRPGNQHHYLENATVALNAVEGDGIKLVNIGELPATILGYSGN